jgi:phage shock protein A
MKESITGRVGRIISSSVNALVDAIENVAPEMVMEEAVREVDGVLDEVRTQLGRTLSQKHLAEQRLAEHRKKHTDLSQKAKLAVVEERDDLAEAAIERQMDIEVQIPVLEKAIAEASVQERELEGYITALQAKRREMREELKRFTTNARTRDAEGNPSAAGGRPELAGKIAKAGSAFDRIMEKNTGLPSSPGNIANGAKLAELEELSRQNRIKERLAAFKASE